MVAVDFFSFRVDAHSMDQNSMAFVSPVASRFEKALSALLPISVSPSRGWDHVGKDIERLRKQAEAVSGEEFTQNEYLRRVMEFFFLQAEDGIRGQLPGDEREKDSRAQVEI